MTKHHTEYHHRPAPPDEVIATPRFEALIDELTAETGRTRHSIAEEVHGCLDEMCVRPSATNTSQLVWSRLSRFMERAYRIDVDDHALTSLHDLNKDASLIFLPNHKSYLDPIFLRSTLARHDFPPDYVLGGDNLAFWPLAPVARRNGIVFIRREFKTAEIYKATLRAYLAYLLSRKANLEWYIEGGRSRTGKLRPPRYGILKYVVDAFTAAGNETAYCVPVSVTYDQQHEVSAISAEDHGGAKSPESVKWLIQYAQAQSRSLGRVHLRFGEPLSIGDQIEHARRVEKDKAEENGEATESVDLDRYVLPKIAFEVCYRIDEVTPITPTSLITFALLDNDDRSLTKGQIEGVLRPLLDYITARELPLTSDVDESETGGMVQSLRLLLREGVVESYSGGTDTVYGIARDRVHEAGFYRNSIAHHFMTRAMVEVGLLAVADEGADDVPRATWKQVLKLVDLLKYEFFFPRKAVLAEQVNREVEIGSRFWSNTDWTAAEIRSNVRTSPLLVAHRTIGPFLEAYEVVGVMLAERAPGRPVKRSEFIEECLGVSQQWWLQGVLHSPESISKNLFSGALQLADNRGLIGTGGEDLVKRRRAFADELTAAVRRVQEIRRIAGQTEGIDEEVKL